MRKPAKPGAAKPRLFIMARLPVAGRVKTRLAKRIGAVAATNRYRHLLTAILRAVGSDPRWETILAVTPASAMAERNWKRIAPHCRVVAQAQGDLGQRMARLLSYAGKAPAAVMGSDIEGVTSTHVALCFQALRGRHAMLAPAEDGGFWLCAVKTAGPLARRDAGPFRSVLWSRADTFERTKGALTAFGLGVGVGPIRRDVDE